jgi:hypothetical protein
MSGPLEPRPLTHRRTTLAIATDGGSNTERATAMTVNLRASRRPPRAAPIDVDVNDECRRAAVDRFDGQAFTS